MATKIEVIKVNKGVPIPDTYTRYPFESLEVGDNFEFSYKKRTSVAGRVSRLNKQGDKQFIVRKLSPETGGVWRIK